MPRSLSQLENDGFATDTDLAFVSAGLAFRAYVSTASAIEGALELAGPGDESQDQAEKDRALGTRYRNAAFEAIVHFQHFAELIVKEALRKAHPLLVGIDEKKHVILDKALKGDPLDDEGDLKTIDAGLALDRIVALLKAGRFDPACTYIADAQPFLVKLNRLRNRLWHRGRWTLRYRALDEFMGGYALPFFYKTLNAKGGGVRHAAWKPKKLHCGLDPLDLIAKEFESADWSLEKVAFLKELARGAYENPLEPGIFERRDNELRKERAKLAVDAVKGLRAIERVAVCPVCGLATLVIYEESEFFYEDDPVPHWRDVEGTDTDEDADEGVATSEEVYQTRWTWLARCENCTLELRSDYGNPSRHGFSDSIENYWWIQRAGEEKKYIP